MMTTVMLVIWALSHSDNGTRMSCSDRFGWSRAPVWTISGMRHYKRLIKIVSDIDCYYCTIIVCCFLPAWYPIWVYCNRLRDFLVYYHVTLHVNSVLHVFSINTLFMYTQKHYGMIISV